MNIQALDISVFTLLLMLTTGLVHSLAQAPVGFLLQMAGNAHGSNKSHRALKLSFFMTVGVMLITMLLLIVASVILMLLSNQPIIQRTLVAGFALISGGFVLLRYFRHGKTTELWIDRRFARGLQKTIDKASSPSAAFGVGMVAVLIELFITAPLLLVGAVFMSGTHGWLAVGCLFVYAYGVSLPLLLVGCATNKGKKIVALQKQRVVGKYFIQVFFGLCIIGLSLYAASGQFLGGTN